MGIGSVFGSIGRALIPRVASTSARTPSFMPDDYEDDEQPYGPDEPPPPEEPSRPPVSAASQMGGNAPPPPMASARAPGPPPDSPRRPAPPPEPDFNSPEGGMPPDAGVSGRSALAPRPPAAPLAAAQAPPQPPAPPNTPGGQKIGLGRQIGGALIQGAGMLFPPVMGAAHALGERVAQGSYPAQERAYEHQMGMQKAQADLAKDQATAEETKQRGRFYGQQADTLAAEGKRGPAKVIVPFGKNHDGMMDGSTGEVLREPSTQDPADYIEIAPEKGQALGLKPDKQGNYRIPKEGIGPFLTGQMKPEAPQIHNIATDGKGNMTLVLTDPKNPAATQKVPLGPIGRPSPPQMPGISLTPEAIQFWGQAAAQGVPLPSMGMGASGAQARAAIINAAPGAAGGNGLAENKASLHADTTSMAAIQKMRDAVVAFENTANANLDLFMKQAKPIIDSGSPLVNTPLRKINRNALGGQDLAAFDAARQVALSEIAKVVSNPNLTGQMSDAARKETLSLIPENATLGQIVRVVGVLRQDMANRKKYLDQGISEIKGRVGRGGQQSTPSSAVSDTGGTIRVRRKADGQTGSLKSADFDPAKYEKVP